MSSCEFQPLVRDLTDVDNPMSFDIDMNIDTNGNLGPIPFDEDAFMPLSPGLGAAQELIEPH
jgi:hypothetical protein